METPKQVRKKSRGANARASSRSAKPPGGKALARLRLFNEQRGIQLNATVAAKAKRSGGKKSRTQRAGKTLSGKSVGNTTPVVLDRQLRTALSTLVRADSTPQKLAWRARIVLACADGLDDTAAARRERTSRVSVGLWRTRFLDQGIAGLNDRPRPGRPAVLPPAKINTVLTAVVQPPKGRTRWSIRSMARHAGVSKSRVQELWASNDLKPHLTRTFKLSRDPDFEPKFWDVIGLYLEPPHKALVLCCDEKSQCQALEHTQPGPPLGVGHIRTRTHDYTRHGTVTLFAALNYLDGKIYSTTAARHTHTEWLASLKTIERQTPRELALHLIVDNYATHKHPAVRAWLARHPRMHLQLPAPPGAALRAACGRLSRSARLTPTGSSWLNLVERFFRDLTVDVVREGSFGSVRALTPAIEDYLAERNLAPKPYRWRAEGAEILRKIHAARAKLECKDIKGSAQNGIKLREPLLTRIFQLWHCI